MIIKMPKEILIAENYTENPYYTEYKLKGKVYTNCYEYIHYWQNYEGKWKCFKKYIEKGNILWYKLEQYLLTGKEQHGVKFIYD